MAIAGEVRDALGLVLTYIRSTVPAAAVAVGANSNFTLALPNGIDDIWIAYLRVVATAAGSTDFDFELYDHSDRAESDLMVLQQNNLAPPAVFARARINVAYVRPIPYVDRTGANTIWGTVRNNAGAASQFAVTLGYLPTRSLP